VTLPLSGGAAYPVSFASRAKGSAVGAAGRPLRSGFGLRSIGFVRPTAMLLDW